MKGTQLLTADRLVSLGPEASVFQALSPKHSRKWQPTVSDAGFLPPLRPFQTEGLREVQPSWSL